MRSNEPNEYIVDVVQRPCDNVVNFILYYLLYRFCTEAKNRHTKTDNFCLFSVKRCLGCQRKVDTIGGMAEKLYEEMG